jgi:2-polyprenyl-3-methyl-5-hydroxy-6-metoxy-1,4-benzoquinol methylase
MSLDLYKDKLNRFAELLPPGAKILDLGCGPGNIAKFMADKDQDYKITGIDFSQEMIDFAKSNVPEAEFFVADIRQLVGLCEQYDAVIASFCIVHLLDDETMGLISKISGMLKQGGLLYLSCMEGKEAGFETTSFSPDNYIFFNYYSEEFIKDALTQNGLALDQYWRQDYPEPNGGITIDMIFIVKK